MNDPEKNKPTLTEDIAKKSNRLSKEIDKEKANQCPAAQTELDLASDIKDIPYQKKIDPNKNILKKIFWLGQAEINLEALTGIDTLNHLLTNYGNLLSRNLMNDISSGSLKIESNLLSISDLEAAYTELLETVDTEAMYNNFIHNQEEIYIISHTSIRNKDNLKYLLFNKLEESKRKAICDYIGTLTHPYNISSTDNFIQLVDSGFTEKTFKELCGKHADKKIYWTKWNESKSIMMLQQIYNPNFYINRNFNKVVINNQYKKINGLSRTLTQDTKDKFIFSGIVDDDYDALGKLLEVEPSLFNRDKIFVKQDLKISKNKFDELSDTVHWLEIEDNENKKQIIWRNSKGSLHGLRNYVNKKEHKNSYGESKLLDAIQDRRVLIIAADPGMGKSTTLTKLYQLKYDPNNFSRQGACNWVIHINLQNHLKAIENINPNAINICNFLSEINKDWEYKIPKDWLTLTLKTAKNHKTPLLIVFDDFHKVTEASNRDKVTALLNFLKNKTYITFWVITSLQYQRRLENALSTFAVTFKPLDDDAQKDFTKQYLTNRLSLVGNKDGLNISKDGRIDNSKIEEYSKAFINKIRSNFKDDKSFIGIPLHFHLLLTSSKKEKNAEGDFVKKDCIISFKNWIKGNDEPDLSYIGKNRLEVYANFIDGKYETYFKKVGIIEDREKNQLKSDANTFCKKLAKNLVDSLQSDIKEKDTDIVLATGLVKSDGNGLAFIHPVLGEYFLSEWCMDLIIKEAHKPNLSKWELLLTDLFINLNYKRIRALINERLANIELTRTTLQKSSRIIKQLSNLKSNTEKEETPLHVAAKEGNIGIVDFLLSSIQDDLGFLVSFISKLDKNGNTAFHIAVGNSNVDFVAVVQKYFDNEPERLKKIIEIQNKYRNTALHIALIKDDLKCVNALLEPFSKDSKSLKELIEIQNNYKNTALHIALIKDDVECVNALLEPFSKDSKSLKELIEIQNNYKNTALHESFALSV